LLTVALTAFQGVLPLAWLYIVKLTVDRIGEASTADPATTFEGVAVLLAAAFGVAVLTAFCQVLADYVNSSLAHLVTDSIQQLVQQKSQSLDLEYYENPGAHEKLHRAQREAPGRPMQIVSELARLAQHFFTFAALLVLLVRFHWGIVVVILVAAVPL